MPVYSPELIATMRAALNEAITTLPADQATPGVKAVVAEVILKLQPRVRRITTSFWRRLCSTYKLLCHSCSDRALEHRWPQSAVWSHRGLRRGVRADNPALRCNPQCQRSDQ